MTLLYSDSRFLDHQTGSHPERPLRLSSIVGHLSDLGLDKRCNQPDWSEASRDRLARVHGVGYIEHLHDFAAQGGGQIDSDTIMSPKSYEVAKLAAGAVCDATERVLRGQDTEAICLVRPPGHHALAKSSMGFCLLNNVAIAASMAIAEFELDRLLIVDWDVHHGNGTQDAFWENEQVGFLSIHRWPFYPGTGGADETGGGKGLGTTLNLPVEFGISRSEYGKLFSDRLGQFAARMKPQLIIISAGFDSHRLDPIGSLGLESEDFIQLTRAVLEVAKTYAGGKVVSVLEGGYNPPMLAESVGLHLQELLPASQDSSE